MTIRFATADDQNQVLGLLDELACQIDLNSGEVPQPGKITSIKDSIFADMVERADMKFFVAEDEGRLVGLASFYILPHLRSNSYRGHIEDFVVAADQRGKGVGRQLFETLKAYCREHKITVMKLSSGFELPEAHKFYEKMGGITNNRHFRFEVEQSNLSKSYQ